MKLFPTTEEKKLKTLLKMAVEPKEALNLDALHGFLFGLAITPEPVNLSEWLPCIFGKQLLRVEGRTNSLLLLEPLFNAYNRLMKDQYDGDLMCPFADLEPEKVNRAQKKETGRAAFFASITSLGLLGYSPSRRKYDSGRGSNGRIYCHCRRPGHARSNR